MCGLFLSSSLPVAYGRWEPAKYDQAEEGSHHVSITGTAEGWHDTHGHPKLRVSCDATSSGGDVFLAFHFPAEHAFLQQNSRHEPVSFRVSGSGQDGLDQETIEYLSAPESRHSELRTLLVSDGVASTAQSGKLLLDLYHGQYLDVRFMQQPQSYDVRYNLAGFSDLLVDVMHSCRMYGFSYASLNLTWNDYIQVVEVAGAMMVERPRFGAAKPADKLP